MALVGAGGDVAQLKAIARQLSERIAEFSAAASSETLAAVRAQAAQAGAHASASSETLDAVRALLDPERYGATRDEARAAVSAYVGDDSERAAKVRSLLASYTYPGGQMPFKS